MEAEDTRNRVVSFVLWIEDSKIVLIKDYKTEISYVEEIWIVSNLYIIKYI